MGGFAHDTRVESCGGGRYAGEICPGWDIGGNANGGYLLAIAARAMALETGRPDPVTITGHYLAPGRAGAVVSEVRVIKSGRRFAVAGATLSAADKPLLAVLGTFGELSPADPGIERIDAAPPDLPARRTVWATTRHAERRR